MREKAIITLQCEGLFIHYVSEDQYIGFSPISVFVWIAWLSSLPSPWSDTDLTHEAPAPGLCVSLAAVQGELTALTDRVPGPGPADPGVRHHVVLAALLDQLGAPDHHRELVGERQGQQD